MQRVDALSSAFVIRKNWQVFSSQYVRVNDFPAATVTRLNTAAWEVEHGSGCRITRRPRIGNRHDVGDARVSDNGTTRDCRAPAPESGCACSATRHASGRNG